jgi:hypothetical protein
MLIEGTHGANTDVNPPKTDDPSYVSGAGVGTKGSNDAGAGLMIVVPVEELPNQ